MRVQRVVMPETGFESWTLLGDDQLPVEPVERFLAYLASIEKSPNTIKAYAHVRFPRFSGDFRTRFDLANREERKFVRGNEEVPAGAA